MHVLTGALVATPVSLFSIWGVSGIVQTDIVAFVAMHVVQDRLHSNIYIGYEEDKEIRERCF